MCICNCNAHLEQTLCRLKFRHCFSKKSKQFTGFGEKMKKIKVRIVKKRDCSKKELELASILLKLATPSTTSSLAPPATTEPAQPAAINMETFEILSTPMSWYRGQQHRTTQNRRWERTVIKCSQFSFSRSSFHDYVIEELIRHSIRGCNMITHSSGLGQCWVLGQPLGKDIQWNPFAAPC